MLKETNWIKQTELGLHKYTSDMNIPNQIPSEAWESDNYGYYKLQTGTIPPILGLSIHIKALKNMMKP